MTAKAKMANGNAYAGKYTDAQSEVIAGSGATLTLAGGTTLLDFSSSWFGYGHQAVLTSVAAQMNVLPQSTRMFLNHPLANLVTRLAEVLPGDLSVTYPCNSAGEAVEGALKLALGHHRRSGRSTFVATTGSDHGHTAGAAAVSSVRSVAELETGAPFRTRFVPFGDLAALHRAASDHRPAGIVVEPIATGQGLAIPGVEYLTGVREVCERVGALLIVNETATGLGATGNLLACDRSDVVPDIVILGSALGGGVLPVGAYVTTEAINDRVYGHCGPWMHGSATGGNPLACASAVAALDVIIRDDVARQCAAHGATIAARLVALADRFPDLILNSAGAGHLAAVHWRSAAIAATVSAVARREGLLLHSGRFATSWTGLRAPLIATTGEIDAGLEILEEVAEHTRQKAAS